MVYTLRFFSLKCSLFHNSNLFGSCIIHILYTECAKIKKIIPAPKVKNDIQEVGCLGMDWVDLGQDRDRCWALANVALNFWVP